MNLDTPQGQGRQCSSFLIQEEGTNIYSIIAILPSNTLDVLLMLSHLTISGAREVSFTSCSNFTDGAADSERLKLLR